MLQLPRRSTCNWLGHTLRRSDDRITKHAVQWTPQGHTGRGKEIWSKICVQRASDAAGGRWRQQHNTELDGNKQTNISQSINQSISQSVTSLLKKKQKNRCQNSKELMHKGKCHDRRQSFIHHSLWLSGRICYTGSFTVSVKSSVLCFRQRLSSWSADIISSSGCHSRRYLCHCNHHCRRCCRRRVKTSSFPLIQVSRITT